MKKIIYISLIFFSIAELSAQTEWTVQNPITSSENLNCVSFIDLNTGFISGSNFTLLKTTNGGNNWLEMKINLDTGFYRIEKIKFINSNAGYILNDKKKLFKTTNSGVNFVNINYPINYNLNNPPIQMDFLNENTGFIYNGNFLKTTNGGKNWNQLNFPELNDLKDFKIKNGKLYLISSNKISNKHYYAISNDTGKTFNFKPVQLNVQINNLVEFDNYNNFIYIVASTNPYKNLILKSVDEANTWSVNQIDSLYFFNEIIFFNETTGIILLGTYNQYGKIKRTTDGGLSWNNFVYDENPNYGIINGIKINNSIAYLCGTTGLILKTTNAGSDWIELSKRFTSNTLTSGSFKNSLTGVIVGVNGTALRTTNGGVNWDRLELNTKINFNNIFLFSDGIGYITGDTSGYYKTTNNGVNWIYYDMSLYGQKFYGSFISSKQGCITGGYPLKMVITNDGGENWYYSEIPMGWSQQYGGTASNFQNVNCLGTNKFIATQSYTPHNSPGRTSLFYTTNSGLNWTAAYTTCLGQGVQGLAITKNDTDFVYFNPSCEDGISQARITHNFFLNTEKVSLNSNYISFYNKNFGISTNQSGVYYTVNSGRRWTLIKNYLKDSYLPILADSVTAYFIGYNGKIIKASNINKNDYLETKDNIVANFELFQNYPNPFNPTTNIDFQIKNESFVELEIYDLMGRKIKTLLNKNLNSGSYSVKFEAENLSSGIYFYKLKTLSTNNEIYEDSKKMLLLK
ncbi:MAG: T9SS type A sorting domain-containing protein [Ignavibacteria bacterium]|nr:T9SS type A sorting domain-containing protein [Ignavibacteria bacterium]